MLSFGWYFNGLAYRLAVDIRQVVVDELYEDILSDQADLVNKSLDVLHLLS